MAVSILLVEDNPGDARLIRHHLEDPVVTDYLGGVDVTHVESLGAGQDTVDGAAIDVVLLDLGLPESSGLETLDRFDDHGGDVPVVVLTGNTDRRTAVETIRQGAQDYLTKDAVDSQVLARSLRYAIERVAQERQLRRQNERLEEFARVLAHDVRNPLNVAEAYLSEARASGEADTTYLDVVAESHDRIRELVEDVLELARQGATIGDVEAVELADVVEDAATNVELDGLCVTTDDHLPTLVGDHERLVTLVENLLRNATEHAPAADEDPSDVTVCVRGLPNGRGFVVEDDGRGVPPEDRSRILESGFTTTETGTGFGLAICKRIVDAHGWSLSVGEPATGGTRFEVRIGESGDGLVDAGHDGVSDEPDPGATNGGAGNES